MPGLMKPKNYDWKDSNLALFGSDTDKKVKKESAESETAWSSVLGISEPSLVVWRINQFKVEQVPKQDYGRFYSGDSYIVLSVSKCEDQLNYDIFFWIGGSSTQDEYGTAAYKTVELDALLDGRAIQHREVEGFESPGFKKRFKIFELLAGGYQSGFRHVEPDQYEPRLLRFNISSGKYCEVTEVTYSLQSLQSDDVFILDLGSSAIQWNGKLSRPMEKNKAALFLQQLESERNGRCVTSVIDESEAGQESFFMKSLPDSPVIEQPTHKTPVKALYRMSDESGEMEFILISEGTAPKSMVDDNDVFFIVTQRGLFVYIGKLCSESEKQSALGRAHHYLKSTQSPFLPVVVVPASQSCKELELEWD